MRKIEFGDGQYVVYANDEQEAINIIGRELGRVDIIKDLMSQLLVEKGPAWQNFMTNTSEDRLNIHFNDETSLIYDDDEVSKGKVRRVRPDDQHGYFSYDLAYRYPDIQGHNADFRLAHEMGHLMLNPCNIKRQTHDKDTQTVQVAGLIRVPEGQINNPHAYYGEQIQENAINLLAQLAIRGEHSADDIIIGKVDLSESNLYKRCDELVKLLVISMRNDFGKQMSFEQLVEQGIDSIIHQPDGTKTPANLFFYGILNDSSMIEKEFDKYMGNEAWRDLNTFFEYLHKPNTKPEMFEKVYQEARGMIMDFTKARLQDKTKGQDEVKNKPSIKQKVAQALQKNNLLMKVPFVEKFVNNQLNVLPIANEQLSASNSRHNFIKSLSNDGKYRELPPVQRKSEPRRMAEMKRKMEQGQRLV